LSELKAALSEEELTGAGLHAAEVDGETVLLSRSETGDVCAIADACTHRGGLLHEGERVGDTVICPWHGSEFDLCSGEVKRGPAREPQKRYEVRLHDGMVAR
jgi:nitrite reductase/ring-hydroxylating ferredoxin subunit